MEEDDKKEFNRANIHVGDVFRVKMYKESGFVPKDGDQYRYKMFVVLGINDNGDIYGGLVVNSKINKNVSPHIRFLQYPISKEKYKFLRHDSFIDCSRIFPKHKTRLLREKHAFVGRIHYDDLQYVIATVINSVTISKKQIKEFNISEL